LILVLVALAAPAAADELLKFKNGHRLVAKKTWVEGDILYVKLEDGSVLGFPKDLVESEGTTNARYVPLRNTNRVTGSRRGYDLGGILKKQQQNASIVQGSGTADQAASGRPLQIGYSMPAGRDEVRKPSSRVGATKPDSSAQKSRHGVTGEGERLEALRGEAGPPPGSRSNVPTVWLTPADNREETRGTDK
jgi:hypothetical protein